MPDLSMERIDDLDCRDLVEHAVKHPVTTGKNQMRWSAVRNIFAHGSGVSSKICKSLGYNPDDILPGHDKCDACPLAEEYRQDEDEAILNAAMQGGI